MVILERFHDSRGETFGTTRWKGVVRLYIFLFLHWHLSALKTLDLELQNIKRDSEISRKFCMIYLLVLHDQMINAKFLISRLFDESPSVALWSFQFFNTYKLPGTWWFWLPLVCLISFVPHHQSDRLMFILTLLHFSYWLAHVLFDGRLACSGIFDSTVSDDVIRMMSYVDGFSKPYGCSSNNHNWITQPGKGQESYLF